MATATMKKLHRDRRVVTVVLVLCLVAVSVTAWFAVSSTWRAQRMLAVLGNAVQVAAPEYRVEWEPPEGIFSLRLPISFTRQSSGTSLGLEDLVQDSWGQLSRRPSFPTTDMTQYVRGFRGGQGDDPAAKQAAEKAIRSLGESEWITAVVELSKPLHEQELIDKMKPYGFGIGAKDKYFFMSSASGESKPVFWWGGRHDCTKRGLANCDNSSATRQFQQWVAMLEDGDQSNLRRLGLDLKVLRQASSDGRIYGFIANWTTRQDLLTLLAKTDVRNIYVVEMIPNPKRV